MQTKAFPSERWDRLAPEDAGLDPDRLESLRVWLDTQRAALPYRLVIVRHGCVVTEWNFGLDACARLSLASGAKSVYSCMLGIAIAEGRLPSADARVVDYYPEMMDVPPGAGPKEGRHAFPKDAEITFRQLISNTSGYMKPGEEPGRMFHYQTYGMNILTHSLGKIYGVYDTATAEPTDEPGFGAIIDRAVKKPIEGTWRYQTVNFRLGPEARVAIFGNYCGIYITALDMARLGWLWLCGGTWRDRELVPSDWLSEATHVAPSIREHCPRGEWAYGYGFWTNEFGILWPELPPATFCASGAGHQLIWAYPDADLVVAQGPGISADMRDETNRHVLSEIVAAIVE